jgi:predicted metal-binding membrane protein
VYRLVLLATGVMDREEMALITAAITLERLATRPVDLARLFGGLMLLFGVSLIAHFFFNF